jgi:hypothetical protein
MLSATPDDKAALQYLRSAGAGAISIVADVDGVAILTGYDAGDETIVETLWLPAEHARSIAAGARHIAAKNPDADVADLVAAIRAAAAERRVILTLHDTAMQRASANALALNGYVEKMRQSGALCEFNRQYKAHRLAAAARGAGAMSYATAMLRLRKALIPILVSGGADAAARFAFKAVFESTSR